MKKDYKIIRKLCYATLAVLSLSACTQQSSELPTRLSAAQYLTLAKQATPQEKPTYQLAAANQYLQQKQAAQARHVLDEIQSTMTPQQAAEKQLLEAKVALLRGEGQTALNILTQIQGNNVALSTSQTITLHQLLADTYQAMGNTIQSINQRLQLESLITDPATQRLNLIALWHSLESLSVQQLNSQVQQTQSTSLKGWLSLALIVKQSKAPGELVQNLRQWEATYPNHPALSIIPKNFTTEMTQPSSNNKEIALLLPLHGSLAPTGEAIRNGFLAAYYAAEKQNPNMPHLKVYNTANEDVVAVYQKALQDGASLVVGPLVKNELKSLIDANVIRVPTLALNTLTDQSRSDKNLFQFGLSPLDEAEQAANRAWQQGNRRAAIIATQSEWGQGIAQVFAQTWKHLGGTIVAQVNISPSTNLAQQISTLLKINASDQGYQDLRQVLHTDVRYLPRRREDIDMIYLVTQPVYAKQIVPLLTYYYAGDIPVYSISQIYNGQGNGRVDRDLNGIYFCDMPWVLSPGSESQQLQQLRQQIRSVWPSSYAHNAKLYALGIDAFRIATQLPELKSSSSFSIDGATGELYLDHSQHVYRRLQWARFKDGSPVLLN